MEGYTYRKSTVQAAMIGCINVFVLVVASVACYCLCLAYPVSWSLYPLMLFFLGARFRAINNISHECYHYSFCDSRDLNRTFGELFAILELSSFKTIQKEHFAHHKYLGDLERDLDLRGLGKYGLSREPSREVFFEHLKRALTLDWGRLPISICWFDRKSPVWARCVRIVFLGLLVGVAFCYLWYFIAFIILPYFYAFQVHKYLMDVIDHGGLVGNSDKYIKTRNFMVRNKVLSWVLLPRNDGYHLVHHLYPALSVEVLPKVHRFLLLDSRYGALCHDARSYLKKWSGLS